MVLYIIPWRGVQGKFSVSAERLGSGARSEAERPLEPIVQVSRFAADELILP